LTFIDNSLRIYGETILQLKSFQIVYQFRDKSPLMTPSKTTSFGKPSWLGESLSFRNQVATIVGCGEIGNEGGTF
jgi:hypothetical protein